MENPVELQTEKAGRKLAVLVKPKKIKQTKKLHPHLPLRNMNTKLLTITLAVFFAWICSPVSYAAPGSEETGEWPTNIYAKIGLKIQLPHWRADIDDQEKMWSLMAYPLVENPAADTQYRVVISVFKLTEKQHLRLNPKPGTNSFDWMNSQHLQTGQMTNALWIFFRRDVFRSNGFAYKCVGRVKRVSDTKLSALQQAGGNEEKLAVDVQRILDSIEELPTNPLSRLFPNMVQQHSPDSISVSDSNKQPKDLNQIFNAMTPTEIEHVKKGFDRLQLGITPEECFVLLGIDLKRQYPTSTWGLPEKQSVSLMLSQGHVLLLVWNAKSESPRLLSAQLDDLKWPKD